MALTEKLNPNDKFDLLPYMAMSRDQISFSPITCQGSILTSGVIHIFKIHRSNIMSTAEEVGVF